MQLYLQRRISLHHTERLPHCILSSGLTPQWGARVHSIQLSR